MEHILENKILSYEGTLAAIGQCRTFRPKVKLIHYQIWACLEIGEAILHIVL